MRKIVFGFCALTVATWLLNLGFNPPAMNGRSLTHEVFFLNGVLAWGLMAMAIVIAARPAWLEKVTATPLDELYKWHRTLGIWAAVLTLFSQQVNENIWLRNGRLNRDFIPFIACQKQRGIKSNLYRLVDILLKNLLRRLFADGDKIKAVKQRRKVFKVCL